MPKFSVIVPTYNEEKFIGQCLESIEKQLTNESYEVIVADSHSTDNTVKIAEEYADKVVLCGRGISAGRNAGARASSGRYLVFVDADSIASPKLIDAYVDAFSSRDVVAATGPVLPKEKLDNIIENKLVHIGSRIYTRDLIKLLIRMGKPAFIGSNAAFRRDKFFEVGGFREDLNTFEDGDLSMRLVGRGSFVFHDDAVVYTSIRRVKKWGYLKFIGFHTSNLLKFMLFKKPHEEYEVVR